MLTAGRRIIDKRGAPRHRVLKQGMLAFDHGGGVDCIVRNLSPNGARIDIVNPVGLPEVFTLVIETDQCRLTLELDPAGARIASLEAG